MDIQHFTNSYLNIFIRIVLYIVVIFGLYLLITTLISENLKRSVKKQVGKRVKYLVGEQGVKIVSEETYGDNVPFSKNKTLRYLQFLLKSTTKNYDEFTLSKFIGISIGIFVFSYVSIGLWTNIFPSHITIWKDVFRYFSLYVFILAVTLGCIPLGWKIVKLRLIRVDNSFTLVDATELLQLKYRTERYDIYFAMKSLVKSLRGNIKFAFALILDALQTNNPANVAEAIELFIYQIDTSWAKQVGIMIDRAYSGRNIDLGLTRINKDMVEIRNNIEEYKTNNMESVMMGLFPSVLFPLSLFFNSSGATENKSWEYYFTSDTGKEILIVTILVCIICALITLFIRKPKYEV